jgi:hypothetical protein
LHKWLASLAARTRPHTEGLDSLQVLALLIVTATGLWLVGVASLMALRPRLCLRLLEKMSAHLKSSNWRLQFVEQGLRILAGTALIVRAPATKVPLAFEIAGWLLVLSSLLIIVAPIRWHGAYGTWWTKRLTATVIRILFPFPAMLGAGLIYAAL